MLRAAEDISASRSRMIKHYSPFSRTKGVYCLWSLRLLMISFWLVFIMIMLKEKDSKLKLPEYYLFLTDSSYDR